MTGRLEGKRAVVVGAGQTPGETMGNGRATAVLFAREGAEVVLVDRDEDSANETREMVESEGGAAHVVAADISREGENERLVTEAVAALGGIDVLHNNVGIGAPDGSVTRLDEDGYDRIMRINLRAMWLTCKHTIPVMREQGTGGSIVNISSLASISTAGPLFAYKLSKVGVNALTESIATGNARFGIRANAILPGLINTPMAVDARARSTGQPREEIAAARDRDVPTGRMGSAWDVAHAALFLASDEAAFISGVLLPVDGGQHRRVG